MFILDPFYINKPTAFLRHVACLEKQLTAMDAEYDKCNLVFTTGEVNGFNGKLPACNL